MARGYQARASKGDNKSPYRSRARNVVERNPFAGANAGAEIKNGGTMKAEDSPSGFDPKGTLKNELKRKMKRR